MSLFVVLIVSCKFVTIHGTRLCFRSGSKVGSSVKPHCGQPGHRLEAGPLLNARRSTSGCIRLLGDRRFPHARSLALFPIGTSTGIDVVVSANGRHGL